MLLTGNPGGVGHQQLKRLFVDKNFVENENPTDYAFVQSFVQDNKALMDADPEYVKRLEDLPEQLRRAYLFGDWNINAGQMFPQLFRHTHVVEPFELPNGTRYFAGFDWGFQHPYAFVLFAIVPDGQIYVVGYIHKRTETTTEIAPQILTYAKNKVPLRIFAGADIWSRKSNEFTIYDEFVENGLNARNKISLVKAHYDNNSRIHGVNTIRKYISGDKPKLLFFSNCLPVFNSIADMQIDPDNIEDVLKVNADDNGFGGDDLYDAFRYGLYSYITTPNVPIQDLPKNSPMYILQQELKRAEQERKLASFI